MVLYPTLQPMPRIRPLPNRDFSLQTRGDAKAGACRLAGQLTGLTPAQGNAPFVRRIVHERIDRERFWLSYFDGAWTVHPEDGKSEQFDALIEAIDEAGGR
jgi:hypothetical protein